MICELNAPARPRSAVTSSSATRSSRSCSERIGSAGTLPAASAACRVIRRIAPAYGRSAAIRCSARRRRAAATVSSARVIFWMFLTELILFLTSRCEAMVVRAGRPLGGGGGLLAHGRVLLGGAVLAVGRALGGVARLQGGRRRVVHRLALLVEVVAE